VLAEHQFTEDGGGCTGRECDWWGLHAGGDSDNDQMAEHQIEMLAKARFTITAYTGPVRERSGREGPCHCDGPAHPWSPPWCPAGGPA
jgi:hypothetical protein